jgi:hypothetical protein
MNDKFPNPIESISNINQFLGEMDNNPELLKKYCEEACTIIDKDKKAYLRSEAVTKAMIELIAKEKGIVVDLPSFDSQKFKNNYLGLDLESIQSIRLKVSKMNTDRNKKFFKTPAEIESAEPMPKLENVSSSAKPDDAEEVEEKKSKWVSGADEATKKFE